MASNECHYSSTYAILDCLCLMSQNNLFYFIYRGRGSVKYVSRRRVVVMVCFLIFFSAVSALTFSPVLSFDPNFVLYYSIIQFIYLEVYKRLLDDINFMNTIFPNVFHFFFTNHSKLNTFFCVPAM